MTGTLPSAPGANRQGVVPAHAEGNSYLWQNYGPVRQEDDYDELEVVSGEIPKGLAGSFYRNGPDPRWEPVNHFWYHWFDGDGMVSAYRFKDGKVSFKNRWVRTWKWQQEDRAGHALFGGVRSLAADTKFAGWRAMGLGPLSLMGMKLRQWFMIPEGRKRIDLLKTALNCANTNVQKLAGHLLAMDEMGVPYELDPETLATIGPFDFGGGLLGASIAHPKVDYENGDVYTIGYDAQPPYVRYYVFDRHGKRKLVRDVPVPYPMMMHDFAITETKVIFFHLPATFRALNLATRHPVRWEPQLPATIWVADRNDPDAEFRTYACPQCFTFHPLNAYDHPDGNQIVVDLGKYPRVPLVDLGSTQPSPHPQENPEARLVRWHLHLGTGELRELEVDDAPMEFPHCDDRYLTKRHRFAWDICRRSTGDARGIWNSVMHYDFDTGDKKFHDFGPTSWASEAMFAPRSKDAPEGDGWLLVEVFRSTAGRTELVILEATDVEAPPVAVVRVPRRVQYGFHGNWVPDWAGDDAPGGSG